MKFQNIPYEKMDIGIILKLANDFKITVKNETKETEIIKYEKEFSICYFSYIFMLLRLKK